MKTALLLTLILFVSLVNSAAQSPLNAQKLVEFDEYDVYKAVLKALFIKPESEEVVIQRLTYGNLYDNGIIGKSDNPILLSSGRENVAVEPETIENYNSLNTKPVELKNDFGVDIPVSLVSDAELEPVLDTFKVDGTGQAYKDALLKKYKTTTVIRLSRVAFNKDKKQALIHVGHICGTFCGEGRYLILSKKKDGWFVMRIVRTWIS